MFETARLKLTAWYLVIIMAISLLFSVAIYLNIRNEFRRFERISEVIQIDENRFVVPLRQFPEPPKIDATMIQGARIRVITALGILNAVILILAGTAGYFLAGRTLKPIREMVEEQNRFISDASHELRTPLTALKSTLEVHLRDKNLTLPDAKKVLEESVTDVNTLQSLSDSLLTLAQYQKPNGQTPMESLEIPVLVQYAIKQVNPLAQKKNIVIKKHLENIHVSGIRHSLVDLLVILLDNAIKYSNPNGTVTITAKKNDKNIILSVKDEGVGISKKDLPFIFDRFYRADSARTKSVKDGYGLGLAIAKKIVDLHQGTLRVKSTSGKGSIFTVTFSA